MNNRSFCNLVQAPPAISMRSIRVATFAIACLFAAVCPAFAGDAPAWMHAVTSAPLPAHDEKTDAVMLYEEVNVSVVSADKIKTQVRRAYKSCGQMGVSTELSSLTSTFPPKGSLPCMGGAFLRKEKTTK